MSTRLPRFFAALVGSAALVSVSLPAHAAVINFDDVAAPSLFSNAQPLTSRYAPLGVTFSGTGAVLNEDDSDYMVMGNSGLNVLAYNSKAFIGPLSARAISEAFDVFTFSTPLNAVSFLAGSGLTGPPTSVGRTLQVRAFNAAGMMVDSEDVTLQPALRTVFLSGMAISRVTLAAARNFDDEEGVGFVVDDINTAPSSVPEPAGLMLLGSALAGVLVSRRSRARR